MSFALGIPRRGGQRGGARIDGLHLLAGARKMQGETACRGETVERLARRIARSREIIFALVEKDAGLLPVEKIGFHLEPVHVHGHGRIQFARQEPDFARKFFERADRRIVAGHDGARRKLRFERRHDLRRGAIHTLVEHLDDETIAIAIDDQRGQEIRFGVNHPVRIGIRDHLFAEPLGRGDSGGDVERLRRPLQHAQRDLRAAL